MLKRSCAILAAAATVVVFSTSASAVQLWNNGGIITNPTGGTGTIAGQPISNIQAPSNTFGFGWDETGETTSPIRVADDFTVGAPGWDVDTVTLFGYQTGATTPTITSFRLELFSGVPGAGGTSLGAVTNPAGPGTLVAYRQDSVGTSDTTRRVFSYTVNIDNLLAANSLTPGTYWLSASAIGSLVSGPWVPPVTPRAQAPNLNARQRTTPSGVETWIEIDDDPSTTATLGAAIPFILDGTIVPEPATLGLLGFGGLALIRRRR